jgi:hypothetical protein
MAKTARSASAEHALGILSLTVFMRLVFLHMHATSVGVVSGVEVGGGKERTCQ